jgi:FtsZ-binding cell division protein ZapB
MDENADQIDILAQNEQLTADLTKARNDLTAAQTANTELQTKLDEATKGNKTLTEVLATRTQERNTLKTENEQLKSQTADFNKRLASELAKHGIRQTAVTAPPQKSDKPMTATEKVLAAKGVASLNDLQKAS